MRTADIIFYNAYQHPSIPPVLYREDQYYRPFLPVTTRERGSRWDYGNRTIGGYKHYTLPGKGTTYITPDNVWEGRWVWEWVDPRNITMTMAELFERNEQVARRNAEDRMEAVKQQRAIKARFDATGLGFHRVMEILGEEEDGYRRRQLLRGERTNLHVNPDQLLKLITAAQLAVPEVRHAKEQAEVEAALANLAGM